MDRALGSDLPDEVRFLTSLLSCHPQVGSASLTEGGRVLVLEFFLDSPLRSSRLREFSREFKEALEVFCMLKGLHPGKVRVQRAGSPRSASQEGSAEGLEEPWPDRTDSFQLSRDLDTVTVEELSMLVALVEEEFPRDLLIGDELEEPDEETREDQETQLFHSLERLRHASRRMDLVGFRDDLRVLVYPAGDPARRSS